MPFQRIPVQIWGPAYEDRSLPFSSQSTINLFPSRPAEGRSIRALHSWPGAKAFSTGGSGVSRGMGEHVGVLYTVSGSSLYSISSSGVQTTIGTISGSGRCDMRSDGVNLIISTGSTRYQYNGTTLSEFTDVDHEGGNTAAYVNNQMVYDGLDGRFWVAEVSDPDNINALNFATAESNPDNTVAVHEFRLIVRLFGSKSTEPWYNDGSTTNPPFSRIDSAVRPVGLGATYSIANDDSFVYFLSSDRQIYRTVDIDMERITPVQMESFLEEADISDAFGVCMFFASQSFYILTFPTSNKTWVIPTSDPANCFQLSTGLNYDRHLMNTYCYCYGKHLIGDYRNGNVYEWDADTYTDVGEKILRERTMGPLNGEGLELTGAEVTMSHMDYVMETGVGNASVLDPVIQCDISYDGGASFTNETWIKVGQNGIKKKVRHNSVRTFYDASPRIRCTEAVKISLHSSAIHVKLAGKTR